MDLPFGTPDTLEVARKRIIKEISRRRDIWRAKHE
jgi:hypothetical protein